MADKKYTFEKVLYFADREEGLHVDVGEKLGTHLSEYVRTALKRKLIKEQARDDSGVYYKTTTNGSIRLLELQIQWRKDRGKDASDHKARLECLKREVVA